MLQKVLGEFWEKKGLNLVADKNDYLMITARINGGFNGFDDRLKILKLLFQEFGITESINYNFNASQIYNDLRFSYGWGLWHDSAKLHLHGVIKDNEKAKV